MPGSEDGAAAAAEAHFEALRRFVDERNIASHQQRPVHANGAHVPPFQVEAGDVVELRIVLHGNMHGAFTTLARLHSCRYHRCLQLGLARSTPTEIAHEVSCGVQQPDTANAAFNKLAGVLAYLCAEVARLRRHVRLCSI